MRAHEIDPPAGKKIPMINTLQSSTLLLKRSLPHGVSITEVNQLILFREAFYILTGSQNFVQRHIFKQRMSISQGVLGAKRLSIEFRPSIVPQQTKLEVREGDEVRESNRSQEGRR